MKFPFVLTFFCLIILTDKTIAIGGLLTPTLRKSLLKTPERVLVDEKKTAFLKEVFGQFLLYIGVNLGVPVTEAENTPDGLKLLGYDSKMTELTDKLFKFVNVVDGVSFSDETCKYKFSGNHENMTEASDKCQGTASIIDVPNNNPIEYVISKLGDEITDQKYVFLLGKGEGKDMEVLMAIEIQPFKVNKRPEQKPASENAVEQQEPLNENPEEIDEERKLKKEEEPDMEIVIRIINSVAESKLKVQYAEQTVPSTNNFLNNVVTSFMLKNDQLVFNLEELRLDLVKMLVYNFTDEPVAEGFDANNFELKKGEDLKVTSDKIKSPEEIDRLGFDPIKFHVNYLNLKAAGAERILKDGDFYHTHGTSTLGVHPESDELTTADEQLLFLLTPSYMNVSPIYVIVTRKGMSVRIVFHSSYFQSTEYFTFAARPFIVKTVERRIKKMANKILRPISILEHQSGDTDFNPDTVNESTAYLFVNTLIKELEAYYAGTALNAHAELDHITETPQRFVAVFDHVQLKEEAGEEGNPDDLFDTKCNEARDKEDQAALICVLPNEYKFSESTNMLRLHIRVLQPHPTTFIKRYQLRSLYDQGLFAKSFARYLVDQISSITSTPENAIKTTLYKNTFPPFEPTMTGVKTTYYTNDIFEVNESGAKPVSVRADLNMKLIAPPEDGNLVKTVAFEYHAPATQPSRFTEYLNK